jgi:putative membrane-bound dehydrogenase-like protein
MNKFPLSLGLLALAALHSEEPTAKPEELPRIEPTEAEQAQKTFQIKAGFRIELAAAEPEVVDPVSMAFDADGRLYVVEMIGYSERRDDKAGRIRLLEDEDDDGRYEKATVFAKDLAWPTGVHCWKGGVLVIVTPDLLYFKDTNGDGVADEKKVIFTGFGKDRPRLNMQALPNSLRWGLDNRIYGATSMNGAVLTCLEKPNEPPLRLTGSDFSFDPEILDLRMESGGGQHGATFDDFGNRYVCSNSRHIEAIAYAARYANNPDFPMPVARASIASDGNAAPVFRISPDEPWRIVRTRWRVAGKVKGPIEGGGRVSGYFTAATGITIYRGGLYGEEFLGNAFTADAGSNLVHRKILKFADNILPEASRPESEKETEFLASTDNWFRPVQLANGPDGALYVLDMYREVIEHPWSLPEGIKKYLDLNSGNDRGRIWRIVPKGSITKKAPKLSNACPVELVRQLSSPHASLRETASRLLYEKQDTSIAPELTELLYNSQYPLARLHAMAALSGLGKLEDRHITRALADNHPGVRIHGLRLSETRDPQLLKTHIPALARDSSPLVRYQLALTLSIVNVPGKIDALLKLLNQPTSNPYTKAAIYSALYPHEKELSKHPSVGLATLKKIQNTLHPPKAEKPKVIQPPLPPKATSKQKAETLEYYRPALELKGIARRGSETFRERCAFCHLASERGHGFGPDVATMKALGREKVMVNLIDPSREIAVGFSPFIVKSHGETYLGIINNETPSHVTLRLPLGQIISIPRKEISSISPLDRSIMPENLESGLSHQDMADLLEFLMNE